MKNFLPMFPVLSNLATIWRLRAVVLFFMALPGCTIKSTVMQIPVVSVDEIPPSAEVIEQQVIETNCPREGSSYGRYDVALAEAIMKVPGANSLKNVDLHVIPKGPFSVCVQVTADATDL